MPYTKVRRGSTRMGSGVDKAGARNKMVAPKVMSQRPKTMRSSTAIKL